MDIMVQYLYFRILEFPLTMVSVIFSSGFTSPALRALGAAATGATTHRRRVQLWRAARGHDLGGAKRFHLGWADHGLTFLGISGISGILVLVGLSERSWRYPYRYPQSSSIDGFSMK